MPRIFVSYRRSDSSSEAGRLFDHLEKAFGFRSIFKDVDSLPAGRDFRIELKNAISRSSHFIVLIGPHWGNATDKDGTLRLHQSEDHVRAEISTAFLKGIPVIPVLVNGAEMPATVDLPTELSSLPHLHALVLRPDPDFRRDCDKLIRYIAGRRWKRALFASGLVIAVVLVMARLVGFSFVRSLAPDSEKRVPPHGAPPQPALSPQVVSPSRKPPKLTYAQASEICSSRLVAYISAEPRGQYVTAKYQQQPVLIEKALFPELLQVSLLVYESNAFEGKTPQEYYSRLLDDAQQTALRSNMQNIDGRINASWSRVKTLEALIVRVIKDGLESAEFTEWQLCWEEADERAHRANEDVVPFSSATPLAVPPTPTKPIATATAPAAPAAAKRFSHPRWDYDCLIPDRWAPGSGGDNLAAIQFFHRDNAAAKILASGNYNNGDSLEESISSALASATELSRRRQTLYLYNYQDGELTREKSPFTGLVVDYIAGQERVRSLYIVTPDKRRQIRIQLFTPIDSFERFTKDFETVLESVRVFSDKGG